MSGVSDFVLGLATGLALALGGIALGWWLLRR